VLDHAVVLTVHVLGPVEARREGEPVELGGPQQRAVLAHLALEPGRVVSVERLIDRLWGDAPPRTPLGTLQSYVSRLRRAVEPVRGAGAAPQVLVSEAPGYVLRIPPEQIDVHQFRTLVAGARAAAAAGRHPEALEGFDRAAALWRGPALAAVGPEDQVRPIVVQLQEERDSAIEDRFETLLALGRHGEAVPSIQAAVDASPLRERRWALLALALYRSSRQAEALRALSSARSVLLEDLGLDPGPELRELERRILAQDPGLALAAPAPPVVSAAPVVERPAQSGPELVGREAEWRALATALAGAGSGRAQLALVEGEPGIGKSTLCEAFLAHATAGGWQTAVGRCVEPGLAPSLWPCVEIVRAMVAVAPEVDGDGPVNALRVLVGGTREGGPTLAPVELADEFVGLLDELAHPWLVLIDDLHWADRATLDVLRLVLERLGGRRVMVIGSHRPSELVPGTLLGEALGGLLRSQVVTTRIKMSPLDASDVARLMELTTGVAPSADMADRVRARAGGNPLFVAELARLAGERGLTDDSAVPEAIRDVVRGRLAQLPERATAELEVAAVLGERFDLRTAMAASERDPDACLDALDAAIVTRILVPEADGFRFAHALVRDAVLAEVSTLRLARLHHRAAEAILAVHGDGPDEAEPVAHHRLASSTFADPAVVAKAVVRAADIARWRGALDAADRLAEQALGVLDGVPRTSDVAAIEVEALESIYSSAYRRGDPQSLAAAAARVTAMAEGSGSEAALALVLFLNWGDVDETEDLSSLAPGVDRARELAAKATDSYAIVTSRFILASNALLTGHLDEAAEHIDVAIAASGAEGPDDPPVHVPLVVLPVVAAMIAAVMGDVARTREHTERRAVAWFSQRSEVDPTANVALAFNRALTRAIFDEPGAVLDELRHIVRPESPGFVGTELATCDLLAGWARARLGHRDGLEAALAAMDVIDGLSERVLRSCLRTFVADACLAVDDDRAAALLDAARAEAEARGEVWWLAETIRLRAEVARRAGEPARAAALLDEAEALATTQGAGVVLARISAGRADGAA
jgi:DNA-binding SARP family transcriptional activator